MARRKRREKAGGLLEASSGAEVVRVALGGKPAKRAAGNNFVTTTFRVYREQLEAMKAAAQEYATAEGLSKADVSLLLRRVILPGWEQGRAR